MAQFSPKWKISYTAVPKNACTSLKILFYYIENEREFVPSVRYGNGFYIHDFYSSEQFNHEYAAQFSDYWKFAVLRDPLQRLVSCYRNRVLFHRELDAGFLTPEDVSQGAEPNPSLEMFVERLEIYRRVSVSIAHHTDPHVVYLGSDPAYYDRLYQLSELSVLVTELSEKTGLPLSLQHEQAYGPPMSVANLSPNAADKLRIFYKQDYDTYTFG